MVTIKFIFGLLNVNKFFAIDWMLRVNVAFGVAWKSRARLDKRKKVEQTSASGVYVSVPRYYLWKQSTGSGLSATS